MPDALAAIHERISAHHFDSTKPVSDDLIRELVTDATHAPSSFNIQHWRFIAVTDQAQKDALVGAAYGQKQVAEAPVTFLILGDPDAYTTLTATLEPSVAAGLVPAEMAATWAGMASGMYGSNPGFARDEAIRSGSLAAMTLMLAATARGLVSGPMIGFDPAAVKQILGIPERLIPVMLLPVGYPAPGNTPRKPRLGLDKVLAFNNGKQF
jgi:nitroreductase